MRAVSAALLLLAAAAAATAARPPGGAPRALLQSAQPPVAGLPAVLQGLPALPTDLPNPPANPGEAAGRAVRAVMDVVRLLRPPVFNGDFSIPPQDNGSSGDGLRTSGCSSTRNSGGSGAGSGGGAGAGAGAGAGDSPFTYNVKPEIKIKPEIDFAMPSGGLTLGLKTGNPFQLVGKPSLNAAYAPRTSVTGTTSAEVPIQETITAPQNLVTVTGPTTTTTETKPDGSKVATEVSGPSVEVVQAADGGAGVGLERAAEGLKAAFAAIGKGAKP